MTRKKFMEFFNTFPEEVQRMKDQGLVYDEIARIYCEPKELERLTNVRRRTTFINHIRPAILERDYHKCMECKSEVKLHVHHIKPISKGGEDTEGNLITLCNDCHAEKHKDSPIYKVMTV